VACWPSGQLADLHAEPGLLLAFGFGTHFWLGASLARLEMRRMFAVLRRLPELALADPSAFAYRPSSFVSGLEPMSVRFTPTAARA
jgi:cytochrome P450